MTQYLTSACLLQNLVGIAMKNPPSTKRSSDSLVDKWVQIELSAEE